MAVPRQKSYTSMPYENFNVAPVEANAAPVEVQDNPEQQSAAVTSNAGESPEVVETEDSLDQHAVDSDDTDVVGTEEDEDDDSNVEAPKKTNSLDKRFAKMRQKQAFLEEELIRTRNELLRRDAEAQTKKVQSAPSIDEQAPNIDDFESYTDWQRASIQYEARKMVQAELAAREQQTRTAQVVTTYQQRLEEAAKRIPDLMETLQYMPSDIPAPADDVLEYVRSSEVGPELAYHFAKNESLLRNLVALPPLKQAIEIAKVEAQLLAKNAPAAQKQSKPKATSAPKPAQALDGGSTPKLVTQADIANDYAAWKKMREQSRRR